MNDLARSILVAVVLMAGGSAIDRYFFTSPEYKALAAEHNRFKGSVEAAGRAQRDAAIVQAAEAIKQKEQADEDYKRRAAADRRTIDGLRKQLDAARDSRGGVVPPSPAGSACPDGLVCFDRAEFERAHGILLERVRGVADEGSAVTRTLDTVKRAWPQ